MARGGKFVPSFTGYRAIMNGPAGIDACERAARELSYSATVQSGIAYYIDSMRGLNRIHTRVTSPPDDRFRERRYRALEIAVSTMGGHTNGMRGYSTLKSRVGAVRKSKNKGWKAPGYRGVRR